MSGGRLPKRIVFGNLEGAVRRGRGGKEKEWTDCVQSDIRAFDIAGDWKATALKAEVWVETVTDGGRRFIRGRCGETSPGEERSNETGKLAIAHGSVASTRLKGLASTSRRNLCTDARRTETCVACRCVA